MKITTHLLFAAILLFSSGCDENENKNEAAAEWPSFWTSEPGHDRWPYQYSPYLKYKIENTHTEVNLKNYLNVYDSRINFQAYDSSTHFLALQVMIYSKEKKQAMQVCSSLSYIYPSEDENSAYLYIALAPENFDEELLNSKRWKLYIESRSEHSSGAYKIREIIPGYAYGDSGMMLSFQKKNDNQGTPYLSFADSSDFEIRIYSHLVENPPKS